VLKFKVFKNRDCIKLVEWESDREKNILKDHFTKKSKDGDFNVLVDRGIWDGMDIFLNKNNEIPIGLWREIHVFSKKTDIKCEITGLKETLNLDYSKDSYTEFVDKLFENVFDEHDN